MMKHHSKRFITVSLAVFMAIAILVTGCGSSTNKSQGATPFAGEYYTSDGASSADYAPDAGGSGFYAQSPSAESSDNYTTVALEDRKVVRHSDLSLETKKFEEAYAAIPQLVTEAGGYIQSQNMEGRSMYYSGDYYERRATIYARVPAEKLDEVTAAVGDLCNVVSQSERIDDITDSYYDTEARLATLRVQEERLLEILKKAETLEEIITLERALSEVRYEIETLTSSLQRMDKQVAYSYLNITLREVVDYTAPIIQPKNFGERLVESFGRSFRSILDNLEAILFFIIEGLPLILIYGGFLLIIVLVVRAIVKAWRRKHPPKDPPPQANWPQQRFYAQGQPPQGPGQGPAAPPPAPPQDPSNKQD